MFFRIFVLILGLLVFISMIYTVRETKLSTKYAFAWIIISISILIFSICPRLIDKIALKIGIHYPPSLLFLVAISFLLVYSLILSVQITKLEHKIKRLTQKLALKDAEEDKN